MRTMIVRPRFGPKPSAVFFALGLLSSTLLSGLAYTPKNTVVATVHVGGNPSSLVVSPDSSTVYVAKEASNSISAIDTDKKKVAFTISVSGQPSALAIAPDGTELYCTEVAANADLEFSTVTRQLIQSYATGSVPSAQAISPDGTLIYIANYNDGTVTVISNGTLLSPISVGGNPIAVIFSPDGRHAYIANQGGPPYFVSVIDTATNTVSAVINSNVAYPAGGIAISPDGTILYLSAFTVIHPGLGIVSTTHDKGIATIVLPTHRGPGQPAITPDGEFVYVPISVDVRKAGNDQVFMVGTSIIKIKGKVIVGMRPVAVAIAPDGKYAYVSNYLDGTVSVVDITPK
jgi:YVTN family beta-propeller protein